MDALHCPVELFDAVLSLARARARLLALALLLPADDAQLLVDVLERLDQAGHDVKRNDGPRVAEGSQGRVRECEQPGLEDGHQRRRLGPLVGHAVERVRERDVVDERVDEGGERAMERPESLVARDKRVGAKRLL